MDEEAALAVRASCFFRMIVSAVLTLIFLYSAFSYVITQLMVAMSKATFHSIATETSFTEFVAQLCLEGEVVAACIGVRCWDAHFFLRIRILGVS